MNHGNGSRNETITNGQQLQGSPANATIASAGDESLTMYDGRTTQWVGPSSDLDPDLLKHCQFRARGQLTDSIRYISGNPNEPAQFTIIPDHDEGSDSDAAYTFRNLTFQQVKDHFQPYTRRMVRLYFRMVNPTYPIINETRFMRFFEEGGLTNTPGTLLASILLVASTWWRFDPTLSLHKPPNMKNIQDYLQRALMLEVRTPRLVTVQALLLYFATATSERRSSSSELWALTAIVSLSRKRI